MSRLALIAAGAALAAILLLPAGCAKDGFVDPGPEPARVRVLIHFSEDRSRFDQFDDTTPYTRWDWGLYIVHDSRLLPLRPTDNENLKVITGPVLKRDTVFLAPPGKLRLRLLVDGYVGLREGRSYTPVTVSGVKQDFEVDLKAGREITLRAGMSKK
jgi:hypothetical protein